MKEQSLARIEARYGLNISYNFELASPTFPGTRQ